MGVKGIKIDHLMNRKREGQTKTAANQGESTLKTELYGAEILCKWCGGMVGGRNGWVEDGHGMWKIGKRKSMGNRINREGNSGKMREGNKTENAEMACEFCDWRRGRKAHQA